MWVHGKGLRRMSGLRQQNRDVAYMLHLARRDPHCSMAALDPVKRALWELAERHVLQHHGRLLNSSSDPAVLALRDLLLAVFESGAERTREQDQALQDALVQYHRTAPPAPIPIRPAECYCNRTICSRCNP
jgi:hypothetical protein